MYDIIIPDVRMMVANTSMCIISRNVPDVRMMVANVSLCIISCNNEAHMIALSSWAIAAHMIALSSWAIRFLTFSGFNCCCNPALN